MNSDRIFDLIEEIAATSSKTGKEALIRENADQKQFVQVLEAALNPFKTYGIAKQPGSHHGGNKEFDESTWTLIENLRTRTLTGNAARDALSDEMSALTEKSSTLLWRIVSKDLRAGFSESTVNKAIPRSIPTFDCMLAHKFEPARVKVWPQVAEPKLDGVRVLAFVDLIEWKVGFFSRSGKEFLTFDHLKEPILTTVSDYRDTLREKAHAEYDSMGLPDGDDTDTNVLDSLYEKYGSDEPLQTVLDGEIVSGSFNKTVSEVRKKDAQATDAIFNVFDMLPQSLFKEDDKVPSALNYTERRKQLEEMVGHSNDGPVQLLPRYLVSSEAEIHALYESVRARGLEGLIIKDPSAFYHRRRNHAWMKIKAEESTDVPIVGYEEGTGKYEGMLGAIIVAFDKKCHENGAHGMNHDHDGAVRVNVGSGLSDSQRQSFWEDRAALIGRVIEVEFHEITPDGSLRHPRFKRFRDDKS